MARTHRKKTPEYKGAAERALFTHDEVTRYRPTPLAQKIALLFIKPERGEDAVERIMAITGAKRADIELVFNDPKEVAWIGHYLAKQTEMQLGLLDRVMFDKAATGDVSAYNALHSRYQAGKVSKSVSISVSGTPNDFKDLSDDELERLIEEKQRQIGLRVTDVNT